MNDKKITVDFSETAYKDSLKNVGKPPIAVWKRTEHSDLPYILPLITADTVAYFGEVDIPRKIETSSICVTLLNSSNEAVAFMCFCDYPNITTVPQDCWEEWVLNRYGLDLPGMNTFFIHYMVFDQRYYPEFFPEILRQVYVDNEYLEYIVLFIPPNLKSFNLLNVYFNKVMKRNEENPEKVHKFYINCRALHVQRLSLREAQDFDGNPIRVELNENNDALNLRMGFGKLKEIVVFKDSHRKCLIGEYSSVGDLICLNEHIDYNVLNEKFDLIAYNGFKTESPKDVTTVSKKYFYDVIKEVSEKNKTGGLTDGENMDKDASWMEDFKIDKNNENLHYEEIVLLEDRFFNEFPFFKLPNGASSEEKYRAYNENLTVSLAEPEATEIIDMPAFKLLTPNEIYPPCNEEDSRLIPIFKGAKNAFSIEVFVSDKPKKMRMEFDYLQKIFELAPKGHNFCLILLPVFCTAPSILSYFHKTNRLDKQYPYNLYATHQLAATGRVIVRRAWASDFQDIVAMTDGTPYANRLQEDALRCLFSPKTANYEVFLFLSSSIPVGVAVVSSIQNIEFLRARFNLEDVMYFSLHRHYEQGFVKHMMVSPFFLHYTRYFLKELMRMMTFTSLYYTLYPKLIMKHETDLSWLTGLNRWVPVSPRPLPTYYTTSLTSNVPSEESLYRTDIPFSLFYINPRLCSIRKLDDHSEIIIIGNGDMALSFLEQLIFSSKTCYFGFSRIKLISTDGLASWNEQFLRTLEMAVPTSAYYTQNYLDMLGLGTWVEVVRGHLTNIDRQSKVIEVNFCEHYHYDYLFLFCEQQFLKPTMNFKDVPDDKICYVGQAATHLEDYYLDIPQNLYFINDALDVEEIIEVMKSYTEFTGEELLVVYGNLIEAWTCINLLLEFVPAQLIAFIEAHRETDVFHNVFYNITVYEATKLNLIELGVQYYRHMEFVSWEINPETKRIMKILFSSKTGSALLKCSKFFSFYPRTIHPHLLLVFNRSGLAFDSNLVIDHEFKTNDPRIYAGGNLTKYSRRYYLEHMSHCFYSTHEIGAMVAKQFMQDVLPKSEEESSTSVALSTEIPLFCELKEPVILKCILPRGINYLKVRRPGAETTLELRLIKKKISKIMVTGDVTQRGNGPNYFRLMLDENHKVSEITCYTYQQIDVNNMIKLYGKHEKLLNDLSWRYDSCMIEDFYSYFREPWVYAVFHDRFTNLQEEFQYLYRNMAPSKEQTFFKIVADISSFYSWNRLEEEEMKFLYKIMKEYKITKSMYDRLLQFFEYNENLLPMYLTTKKMAQFRESYEKNQILDGPQAIEGEDPAEFKITDLFDAVGAPERETKATDQKSQEAKRNLLYFEFLKEKLSEPMEVEKFNVCDNIEEESVVNENNEDL